MSIQSVVEKFCVQTAVYWAATGVDGYGNPTFAAPVEISVQWGSKIEAMTDSHGESFVSRAQVLVTEDLTVDGYLYLGKLTDLPATPSPLTTVEAFKIRLFTKDPMPFSTTDFVRTVYF